MFHVRRKHMKSLPILDERMITDCCSWCSIGSAVRYCAVDRKRLMFCTPFLSERNKSLVVSGVHPSRSGQCKRSPRDLISCVLQLMLTYRTKAFNVDSVPVSSHAKIDARGGHHATIETSEHHQSCGSS